MNRPHSRTRPAACRSVRGNHFAPPPYLGLEFGGGAKLKEELHHVTVAPLGGEEEGGRACLEGVTKIDTARTSLF